MAGSVGFSSTHWSSLLPATTRAASSGTRSRRAWSAAVQPAVRSNSNSTRSALARASRLRSMPSCSTRSSVGRMPAVSSRVRGTPSRTNWLSSRSRVVPGTSVTMARCLWLSRLSRLDLPTLGRPTIATRRPSRSSSPWRACTTNCSKATRTAVNSPTTAWPSRGGRSSSKSTRASSSAN